MMGLLRESLRKTYYSDSSPSFDKDVRVFIRLSLVLLALLSCVWIALIFDFGGIVQHLGDLLNALDAD